MIPIQQFTPTILGAIIRRQPPSDARTAFAWQIAVGSALARATTVRLVAGQMTVRATDARWITELDSARDIVLRRLQQLLGPDEVVRIRIE